MMKMECWVRFIRMPFVIAFVVAAYLTVLNVATGWERTFLFWMFWLFILATMILEILAFVRCYPVKNK